MRIKLTLVVAVVFTAFPSNAVGATVSVDAGILTYQAAPAEVNDLEASEAAGTVTITDLGAVITAGVGCNQVGAHEVTCSGLFQSHIYLGDLADTASAAAQDTANFSFFGGQGNDVLTDCAECHDPLNGGRGADSLQAGDEGSYLAGRAGADILTGGAGWDTIRGGGGNDAINAADGRDFIGPGSGDDVVDGGTGVDQLDLEMGYVQDGIGVVVDLRLGQATAKGTKTLLGIEEVIGTRAADQLYGSEAPNFLSGFGGDDLLVGRGGPDYLRVDGGRGHDRLFGGPGPDRLVGDNGADRLVGGPGEDSLHGQRGADVLWARDGFRDVVRGGDGVDSARVDRLDVTRSIQLFF